MDMEDQVRDEGYQPMMLEENGGDQYPPQLSQAQRYHPVLRITMAIIGIPLAGLSVMMLLFSPVMLAFMHDDPKTSSFPGNLQALFAFGIYLIVVAGISIYAWILVHSAYRGFTQISLQDRWQFHWSTDQKGLLVLAPTFPFVLGWVMQLWN